MCTALAGVLAQWVAGANARVQRERLCARVLPQATTQAGIISQLEADEPFVSPTPAPPLLLQLAHCFTPPSDVPEAYQCAPVSLALFLTLSVCSVHSLPGCD